MENDFILTSTEFAKIIGVSTESLRSRRRRGLYQDQYVLKNKSYRWKRPRQNQVNVTTKKFRDPCSLTPAASITKHGTRNKNNGNHKRGAKTRYPNKAFELANEFKMVLKSQRKIAAADTNGIFNCKYAQPQWKEFKEEPEEEIGYIKYY